MDFENDFNEAKDWGYEEIPLPTPPVKKKKKKRKQICWPAARNCAEPEKK